MNILTLDIVSQPANTLPWRDGDTRERLTIEREQKTCHVAIIFTGLQWYFRNVFLTLIPRVQLNCAKNVRIVACKMYQNEVIALQMDVTENHHYKTSLELLLREFRLAS